MRTSTTALLALLLALLVACSASPTRQDVSKNVGPDRTKLPGPSGTTEWTPPGIQSWSLSNGLTVWLIEAHEAPLVSLNLVTTRGTGTDEPEKAGLASLVVDMMDEGAGDKDALQLSDALQLLATDYSAQASQDGLTFSMDMLADNLAASLNILGDIVMRPRFEDAEFERVKAQRLASALAREASPDHGASVLLRRVLFGTGYGGSLGSGTRATLDNITLDDIKARYAQLVKPGGGTVVVVGATTKEQLSPLLETAFSGWSGEPSRAALEVTPQANLGKIFVVDYPGSAQSVLRFARSVPGVGADDHFKALVFNQQFAGSFTGRVNMNLREDKGYTYGARGGFRRTQKSGYYAIGAKVKRDTTRLSIDEIIKELSSIRSDKPLTQTELDNGKGALVKSFPGQFERIRGVSWQLVSLVLKGHPIDWYQSWTKKVSEVDLGAAQATGSTYTNVDDFAIVIAGDLAKIAPSLEGLGRTILTFDAQGNPTATPK